MKTKKMSLANLAGTVLSRKQLKRITGGGPCPDGESMYTCTIYFEGGATSSGGVVCAVNKFVASSKVQRVISQEAGEMVGAACQ